MYQFHCKYIESKYSANLLFTPSDSLVYEIKAENVYEYFYETKNLFDFSDYPPYSNFLILSIKKLLVK